MRHVYTTILHPEINIACNPNVGVQLGPRFEGREQCLHSHLGSVVLSRLVGVGWQKIKHF